MKLENKHMMVEIDNLNDNYSGYIEVQRTGNSLIMSKSELYELKCLLVEIFSE